MKGNIAKVYNDPKNSKFFSWIKLIAITGSAQMIVQVVGLLSGIMIIRLLPTKEYGLFTLANTMLGTMTILADGGISAGVMAQGGKVWQSKKDVGIVLATGLALRKKFAIGSLLVSLPVLAYMLQKNGASWSTTLMIVLALVPAFYAALSDSLLEIVPKLNQAILPLQKNQVRVGIGRLILSTTSLFVFPWAYIAIFAASIPRLYGNFKLRAITYAYADKSQLPDKTVSNEILKGVRRLMPMAIYYTVSGQITIWLLSIFGNLTSIGQMGALGRFSMLLSIFSSIFSNLFVPRFARLKMQKSNVFKKYLQLNILLIIVMCFILLTVWIFQNQLLWILGNQYSGLKKELVITMAVGCMNLLAGINFSLLTSRGWSTNPVVAIPVSLLSIVIGAFFIDVSTLLGAIYFNLFLSCFSLSIVVLFFIYNIYSIKEE